VVDLGFGDAGKGTVTDWLVRRTGAMTVVRFNGGAQAGHNVVTPDGRHHTFAQLGSGTFVPGVTTHFGPATVLHPTALAVEARHLRDKGVGDALARFSVSPGAKLLTPFHQSVGRLRELARGSAAHGTCGVGVGEVERDALDHPGEALTAALLADPEALRHAATRAQERLRASVPRHEHPDPQSAREWALLDDPGVAARWAAVVCDLAPGAWLCDDEHLRARLAAGPVVMEGAQGVLLDEWRGFHPHTTWSTCTFDNAHDLLGALDYAGSTVRLGVLRSYHTRHGAGPFPSESPSRRTELPEAHNDADGWQGAFRVGDFDAVLARYALAAVGGVDGLCLTHLDRLAPAWPVCTAYRTPSGETLVRDLALSAPRDLDAMERTTRWLQTVTPVRESLSLGDDPRGRAMRFADEVATRVGAPVWVHSAGPTADDKIDRSRTGLFG